MSQGIVNVEQSGSTKHTIDSYLDSYLGEPMIVAHLCFIHGYICAWWNKKIQWYKHTYRESGLPGFLGWYMTVNYYVQHRDLQIIKVNWQNTSEF